jgi:hypothetical protein
MASHTTFPNNAGNSSGQRSIQILKTNFPAPLRSRGNDAGPSDPVINVSNIRIGGDAVGLVFSAGIVIVFLIGVPALRWLPVGAAVAGTGVSILLGFFHRHHPIGLDIQIGRMSFTNDTSFMVRGLPCDPVQQSSAQRRESERASTNPRHRGDLNDRSPTLP